MAAADPADNEQEILDRRLRELLEELRVVLPGVTVLFAFLLTLPFTARFEQASLYVQDIYFVAFTCTAASTIVLIAPSAYHRLIGEGYDKDSLIRTASKQCRVDGRRAARDHRPLRQCSRAHLRRWNRTARGHVLARSPAVPEAHAA